MWRQYLSLEEAKQAPDGYIIMDGDYGGICYLVCPAKLVMCDEKTLRSLVHDLEDAVFPGDDTVGASFRCVGLALNEELAHYAMGEETGIALETLWLPTWLHEAGLGRLIQQVLDGERRSLDLSRSEQALVKVLHRECQGQKFAGQTKHD